MIIQNVRIKYKIIIRVKCLLWSQSTGTPMFIRLNHFVGRVLCIWWTSNSYLTFRSHQGQFVTSSPWYPFVYYADTKIAKYQDSPIKSSMWYPVKNKSRFCLINIILWGWGMLWCDQQPVMRIKIHNFVVTVLLQNYGGKQVGYLQHHLYCMQNLKSFMVMLIPTGTITVRVICGHGVLRLGIWGLKLWGNCSLIFRLGSRAGWIRLYSLAGMGMNEIS